MFVGPELVVGVASRLVEKALLSLVAKDGWEIGVSETGGGCICCCIWEMSPSPSRFMGILSKLGNIELSYKESISFWPSVVIW